MSIKTKKYKNGLQLLHQTSLHSLPLCSIYVFCNVGSSNEKDQLRGIAHFLEHMVFQSSKYKSSTKLYKQYDKMGTQINAFTTKRYTCFYAKCSEKYGKEILNLFSNMLYDTDFSKKRLIKESHIIREENLRVQNNFQERAEEAFESKIYQHSSFEEPVDHIRFQEVQEDMDYNEMIRWYKWFYVPSNMIISVVSRHNLNHWDSLLQSTDFIKNITPKEKPQQFHDKPITYPYDSTIEYITTKEPGSINTQLIIGFRTVNHYSDKQYIFDLLTHVINGMSGRLFKILRQDTNLVYNANAVTEHSEFTGYFSIQTECKNENVMRNHSTGTKKGVIYWIINILQDLAKKGITSEELLIGKERLRSYLSIESENMSTLCKSNGEKFLLYVQESNEATHHKMKEVVPYMELYDTYYKNITLEQMNNTIREYFRLKNMVVSVISKSPPDKSKLKQVCEKHFKINRRTRKKKL
jgi:predicted Zn-dependent peptidase